ncbi:fukutin-like isoform X2 [Gigantopelta aegis]|uniref:fukutin-like isoform X2 n=1 Tax=Gigantopelta aegis TaxID=1735272 RepID=UPI001B88D1C0|nr:fukutin-like isoform X2 [Gigantopelta aegis]
MRRLTIIKTLAFIGIGFLLLQLISYVSIFKKQPLSKLEANEGDLQKENNRNLYILVYLFQSKCNGHLVPVFVVEPAVLKAWISVNESTDHNNCVFFCKEKNIVTFGVLDSDWKNKNDAFIKSLKSGGLTVRRFTEEDPGFVSANRSSLVHIPTHYLIGQGNRTDPLIHLVVFYTRTDSYFWHSAIVLPQGPDHVIPKITFAHTSGAYDRFTLTRARIDGLWVFLPHTVKEFLNQVPQSTFIECNHTRAALFVGKYGRDDSKKAQLFTRKSRQLLSRAKDVLDDLGVRFWLSSGTCLGWFRQCDIISYSKDIDIGIFIKDYKEDIVNAFESRGLRLKHVFGKRSTMYGMAEQRRGLATSSNTSFPSLHFAGRSCWNCVCEFRARLSRTSEPTMEKTGSCRWPRGTGRRAPQTCSPMECGPNKSGKK